MANGVLIAAMHRAQVPPDEFHDWYDTEHLPERQRVPGFLVCERWIGDEDGKVSVATYDLEDLAVLKGPAYCAIGDWRFCCWVALPFQARAAPRQPSPAWGHDPRYP